MKTKTILIILTLLLAMPAAVLSRPAVQCSSVLQSPQPSLKKLEDIVINARANGARWNVDEWKLHTRNALVVVAPLIKRMSDLQKLAEDNPDSVTVAMESAEAEKVMPQSISTNIIRALQALDNGILAMCQDEEIAWLVETSSNVASVQTADNSLTVVASQRSNVMSNLRNMANTVKAQFQLAGAVVEQGDGYPAWKMNPNSQLTQIVVDTYKELFKKAPVVLGIHAGLECGLFSERYPNMDMVSFGPTLRGVHTPDERLLIPTVQMVWDHLTAILKCIPKK